MTETEFWLAKFTVTDETIALYSRKDKPERIPSYMGGFSWDYHIADAIKLFGPDNDLTKSMRRGSVRKIIRTVTDDGKVIFERAK